MTIKTIEKIVLLTTLLSLVALYYFYVELSSFFSKPSVYYMVALFSAVNHAVAFHRKELLIPLTDKKRFFLRITTLYLLTFIFFMCSLIVLKQYTISLIVFLGIHHFISTCGEKSYWITISSSLSITFWFMVYHFETHTKFLKGFFGPDDFNIVLNYNVSLPTELYIIPTITLLINILVSKKILTKITLVYFLFTIFVVKNFAIPLMLYFITFHCILEFNEFGYNIFNEVRIVKLEQLLPTIIIAFIFCLIQVFIVFNEGLSIAAGLKVFVQFIVIDFLSDYC